MYHPTDLDPASAASVPLSGAELLRRKNQHVKCITLDYSAAALINTALFYLCQHSFLKPAERVKAASLQGLLVDFVNEVNARVR